jgi:hypothetical protein
MKDLSRTNIRFVSFDTTHNLNWQNLYTGVFITENMHGDTEVLGYSIQVRTHAVLIRYPD